MLVYLSKVSLGKQIWRCFAHYLSRVYKLNLRVNLKLILYSTFKPKKKKYTKNQKSTEKHIKKPQKTKNKFYDKRVDCGQL